MRIKRIALMMVAVMAISLPVSVRGAAPPIAELLPPESLGYVELSDMGVFYYLVTEIGDAVIQSVKEETELPEEFMAKARFCEAALEAFDEIKPLLPKSASVGVVSVDPQSGQPALAFVCELSEAGARLASAGGKLLAAVPQAKVIPTDYGHEVTIPDAHMPPIGYAIKDNVLYATMGEGLLDRILSRATANSLGQTAHYKEVNGVIGENAFLSAYINVDAVRETVLPVLPPQARHWVEVLGLGDIHAAGLSLCADEKLVGYNFALQYTEDAPGIPSFLSIPNTPPKGIAYVPEDFSYVTRFTLGPPADLVKKIQAMIQRAELPVDIDQMFAGIKENMGIDVNRILASLGGEVTVGVKIPETPAIPSILACLDAKDPQYVVETLKTLLSAEEAPASITEMEVGGRKIMMIAPKIPVPVSPALAVDGDVIVMGISSAAVEKALAAKESGKNIASKPEFKAAMAGLPSTSNTGIQYVELGELGQLAILGLQMLSIRAPAEMQPAVSRAMEYANKAVEDLEPAVEVVYRTPNGLAVKSRLGTRSLMQVLRNGAAFGAKAAMMWGVRPAMEEEPPPEPPAVTATDVAQPPTVSR